VTANPHRSARTLVARTGPAGARRSASAEPAQTARGLGFDQQHDHCQPGSIFALVISGRPIPVCAAPSWLFGRQADVPQSRMLCGAYRYSTHLETADR
jgi:hypothetical protein